MSVLKNRLLTGALAAGTVWLASLAPPTALPIPVFVDPVVAHPLHRTAPMARERVKASPRELTVVGTGDVLLHESLWRQANRDARGNGYDFRPLFASVRPVIQGADLAVCHLETPVGPPGGPFSGYPLFVVPPQIAVALADTGYDTCSTASNHSLDDGEPGIARTVAALDAAGLRHAGTYRSAATHATPTIIDVRGVQVAHLSYTERFNGLRTPPGKAWLANPLRPESIMDEAARARRAGAEIVIVSLHWGNEYQQRPTADQRRIARQLLADESIDLILGHHAHVVQPVERIGDKWVAYGLGNQVAWQHQAQLTRDGLMARFTFREAGLGRWRVIRVESLPTWMDLRNPARLRNVTAVLADPTSDPALRRDCRASRDRTAAVATPR